MSTVIVFNTYRCMDRCCDLAKDENSYRCDTEWHSHTLLCHNYNYYLKWLPCKDGVLEHSMHNVYSGAWNSNLLVCLNEVNLFTNHMIDWIMILYMLICKLYKYRSRHEKLSSMIITKDDWKQYCEHMTRIHQWNYYGYYLYIFGQYPAIPIRYQCINAYFPCDCRCIWYHYHNLRNIIPNMSSQPSAKKTCGHVVFAM